jgi:hypothetical protein
MVYQEDGDGFGGPEGGVPLRCIARVTVGYWYPAGTHHYPTHWVGLNWVIRSITQVGLGSLSSYPAQNLFKYLDIRIYDLPFFDK